MIPVSIPTNQSFLRVWYAWTHAQVSSEFKRDRERIPDTVQNVRLRLLSKNFIGRWFFKHLTDELVIRKDAERILGNVNVEKAFRIPCFSGLRTSPDSLWKVQDLLAYANFDYERYFYSIQAHTIDSVKVLRLIGAQPSQYSLLQSLWRQNRLFPAEFTEHQCTRNPKLPISQSTCGECAKGRLSLAARGLTFATDWTDPHICVAAAKMRWNDSQLKPFLRDWQRQNFIKDTPEFIMRQSAKPGVIAGLLAYAKLIIKNEVVNDFKRLTRHDDVENLVIQNGASPEFSNTETVAWEGDEIADTPVMVIRDSNSGRRFDMFNMAHDVLHLHQKADLTREESHVVGFMDQGDGSASDCSEYLKNRIGEEKSVADIHRIRASGLQKLRAAEVSPDDLDKVVQEICIKHDVQLKDLFGPNVPLIGKSVIARAELFSFLSRKGMPVRIISKRFCISMERVFAAINRASTSVSKPFEGIQDFSSNRE